MSRPVVFVVEDDLWQAEQYQRVLEVADYTVERYDNGVSAIEAIDKAPPDVIILDMLLAGTTGVALMHELQSYGDTGKVPIVLCTNLAEQLQLKDVESYGVRRILDKTTMQPRDLVTAVRSCLL